MVVATTFRVTTTILQNSNRLNRLLDFSKRFHTHKIIAGAFGVASLVHSAGQLYINPSSIFSQEGITGVAILACFAAPLAGAYFLKKSKYMQNIPYQISFLRPHQFGALSLTIAYAVHNFDFRLVPYAAAFAGVFALDRLIESICYNFKTVVSRVNVLGDQVVEVRVAKPAGLRPSESGQYVCLSFPKEIDSCYDHDHPFTLANSFHENELRFIIAKKGKWTTQLITRISNNTLPLGAQAKIVGPFGSPLQALVKKNNLMLVSTGSGISPFLAILHYHAAIKTPVTLTIIHSTRNKEEFLPLIDSIKLAAQSGVRIKESHFYITNQNEGQFKGSLQFLRDHIKNSGIDLIDVDGISDSISEETCSSEDIKSSDECKIEISPTSVAEDHDPSNNMIYPIIYPTIYVHKNRFNPLSNDIFRECAIFFMPTPEDENFKISDTNHLFLYKLYGQLAFKYENEMKTLDEKELDSRETSIDENFVIAENSPNKLAVKCKDKELCKTILDITKKSGHTLFHHKKAEKEDDGKPEIEDEKSETITNLQAMKRFKGTIFFCGNENLRKVLQQTSRENNNPFTQGDLQTRGLG